MAMIKHFHLSFLFLFLCTSSATGNSEQYYNDLLSEVFFEIRATALELNYLYHIGSKEPHIIKRNAFFSGLTHFLKTLNNGRILYRSRKSSYASPDARHWTQVRQSILSVLNVYPTYKDSMRVIKCDTIAQANSIVENDPKRFQCKQLFKIITYAALKVIPLIYLWTTEFDPKSDAPSKILFAHLTNLVGNVLDTLRKSKRSYLDGGNFLYKNHTKSALE